MLSVTAGFEPASIDLMSIKLPLLEVTQHCATIKLRQRTSALRDVSLAIEVSQDSTTAQLYVTRTSD